MGKVTTSHYKIFDYWKDKRITRLGQIDEHEGDPVIIDWAEPNCWACGRRAIRNASDEDALQDKCKSENGEFDYQRMWNDARVKSKLNRCHIIPAALGGKDIPSNLFLLCEECHTLSPDTTNPANFFRWVYTRRLDYSDGKMNMMKIITELQSEFDYRGIDFNQCLRDIGSEFKYDTLSNYAKKHIGLHATALSDKSVITCVADWIVEQWVDCLLNK